MNSHRSLTTGTKLAIYGAILVGAFAAAAGVAAAVGPIDTSSDSPDNHGGEVHDTVGARPHVPGISIDSGGFRMVPTATSLPADAAARYSFRIVDVDGDTVTGFDVTHERKLHLIVVSRNFVSYHHLHPSKGSDGMWTVDVPALPAGSYRVFADTRPTGSDAITLGTDLAVGDVIAHTNTTTAPPTGKATVAIDGNSIEMTGAPWVGESTLTFSVVRNGKPVVPDPYLGASGHLVALRSGDMAFLHVHPLGDATVDEPGIRFAAQFPTPGTYQLFLDVSIDGTVRTAPFTVEVPEINHPDGLGQHTNVNGQSNDLHKTGH